MISKRRNLNEVQFEKDMEMLRLQALENKARTCTDPTGIEFDEIVGQIKAQKTKLLDLSLEAETIRHSIYNSLGY